MLKKAVHSFRSLGLGLCLLFSLPPFAHAQTEPFTGRTAPVADASVVKAAQAGCQTGDPEGALVEAILASKNPKAAAQLAVTKAREFNSPQGNALAESIQKKLGVIVGNAAQAARLEPKASRQGQGKQNTPSEKQVCAHIAKAMAGSVQGACYDPEGETYLECCQRVMPPGTDCQNLVDHRCDPPNQGRPGCGSDSSSSISSSSTSSVSSVMSSSSSSSTPRHKDCSPSGFCLSVPGAGPDGCSADTDCGHKGCDYVNCIRLPGRGADECRDGSDCQHKECNSLGRCSLEAGRGPDTCSSDRDCGHKGCGTGYNGPGCVWVPGRGPDACTSDGECSKHKECKTRRVNGSDVATCEFVAGEGPDTCSGNLECSHMECRPGWGICWLVAGRGPDQCSSGVLGHPDCKHKECKILGDFASCSVENDPGPDTCNTSADCSHKECGLDYRGTAYCKTIPSPGSDSCSTDTECRTGHHNECVGGTCKPVPGAGDPQCMANIDCGGGSFSSSMPGAEDPRAQLQMPGRAQLVSDPSEHMKQNGAVLSDFTKPTYHFKDAKAKIEIFQDVTCGMCKYAFNNMYAGLFAEYVSKGLVNLEITEFPLIPREKDLAESRAVICAGEQEKYGAYLDKIYKWDTKKDKDRDLAKVAEQASLDLTLFNKCMNSEETKAKLNRNIAEGNKRGVEGTPTIILNGTVIGGAMEFEKLKGLIDRELEASK